MPEINEPDLYQITPDQLMRLVGTPGAPMIVDLCLDEDFALDPRLVPGAVRHSHLALAALPDRPMVLYCQKGRKISQGAAAILRGRGVDATVLEGGQFAWRDAGLPMVDACASPAARPTRWVTAQGDGINRIACPWLIRRFLDAEAEFLFAPRSDVMLVAEKFDVVAFDIEDACFGGPAGTSAFDVMLEKLGLQSDALDRMARVIGEPALAPEGAGLRAIFLGLSQMYRSDLAQMQAGFDLFDALYLWARNLTGDHPVYDGTQRPPAVRRSM